jgi:hypothetical protein
MNMKTLSEIIARTLDFRPGDEISLQRDRTDPNKILFVKHPRQKVELSEAGPSLV